MQEVPLREGTTRLTAIDAHTAGGPLRLITSGLPELSGSTILERQRCLQEQFDPVSQLGLRVLPEHASTFVTLAEQIQQAVNAQMALHHPLEGSGTLYSIIFTDTPQDPAHHSRNVTIFGHGQVDRSPTGVGLSARLAVHDARKELAEHEELVIESILGAASTLTGQIVRRTQVGSSQAPSLMLVTTLLLRRRPACLRRSIEPAVSSHQGAGSARVRLSHGNGVLTIKALTTHKQGASPFQVAHVERHKLRHYRQAKDA